MRRSCTFGCASSSLIWSSSTPSASMTRATATRLGQSRSVRRALSRSYESRFHGPVPVTSLTSSSCPSSLSTWTRSIRRLSSRWGEKFIRLSMDVIFSPSSAASRTPPSSSTWLVGAGWRLSASRAAASLYEESAALRVSSSAKRRRTLSSPQLLSFSPAISSTTTRSSESTIGRSCGDPPAMVMPR